MASHTDRGMDRHRLQAMEALRALSLMKPELLADMLDDDAIMDFPYAPHPFPRKFEGKAAIVAGLQVVPNFFASFTIEADEIFRATDREMVIIEASGRGMLHDGSSYANRYVMLFRFNAGRIILWREYNDPLRLPGVGVASA